MTWLCLYHVVSYVYKFISENLKRHRVIFYVQLHLTLLASGVESWRITRLPTR